MRRLDVDDLNSWSFPRRLHLSLSPRRTKVPRARHRRRPWRRHVISDFIRSTGFAPPIFDCRLPRRTRLSNYSARAKACLPSSISRQRGRSIIEESRRVTFTSPRKPRIPKSDYCCPSPNMAPKKDKSQGPGKKPSAAKVVEDKTFGMKNKKGASAQKQIQQMTANLKNSGSQEEKRKQAEKAQREREKKAAEAAKMELDALMNKPAQIQKVPFGVDPKTVVCIFYKKGDCDKGKKCKFSHDLSLDRKTEKRDLYTDGRAEEEEKKKAETSADWDEEKLKSVVLSKKGNQKTSTDKVCKFFISAIEDGKYGWFWTCPNGGDKCMYKHALPPG